MKIYFAGSIRGGRELQPTYHAIIHALKEAGHEVLSEHIGLSELSVSGEKLSELAIYVRDMKWIDEADCVIADVTMPSLGVGYEIAYTHLKLKKPVLCIAMRGTNVSAMIAGSSLSLWRYDDVAEAIKKTVHWVQVIGNNAIL